MYVRLLNVVDVSWIHRKHGEYIDLHLNVCRKKMYQVWQIITFFAKLRWDINSQAQTTKISLS